MTLLQLIRFPNILIIALTQYLIYFLVLLPSFRTTGIEAKLNFFSFSLLVLGTILVAAAGYILNDILDYEIDLINKPEKVIINHTVSVSQAWQMYWVFNTLALALAFFVSIRGAGWALFLLFPVNIVLLWWYSRNWKRKVFTGNLIVALLCALVPGILIVAEWKGLYAMGDWNWEALHHPLSVLLAYTGFAFLTTLLREMIKDMEDMEGDQAGAVRTLPIVYGIRFAKSLAFVVALALLCSIIYWAAWELRSEQNLKMSYLLIAIGLPTLVALKQLYTFHSKNQFHRLSRLVKLIMLTGLFYLFL